MNQTCITFLCFISLSGCSTSARCPADLRPGGQGVSCECPPGAATRPLPLPMPGGDYDYCDEQGAGDGPEEDDQDEEPQDEEVRSPRAGSTRRRDAGTQPGRGGSSDRRDAAGPRVDVEAPAPSEPPSEADAARPVDAGTAPAPSDASASTASDAEARPQPVTSPEDSASDAAVDPSCAKLWYEDCDRDGFAPADAGSVRACRRPMGTQTCTSWTEVAPVGDRIDCLDRNSQNRPGSPSGNLFGTDNDYNCDGKVEIILFLPADSPPSSIAPRQPNRICHPLPRGPECDCFRLHPGASDGALATDEPECARDFRAPMQASYRYRAAESGGACIEETAPDASVPAAPKLYGVLPLCI